MYSGSEGRTRSGLSLVPYLYPSLLAPTWLDSGTICRPESCLSIIARAFLIFLSAFETFGAAGAPGVCFIIFDVSISGLESCFGGGFSATLASAGALSSGFKLC